MYVGKEEIAFSPYPELQSRLRFLFKNKKIEQFINEVQKMKKEEQKVSQFALQMSQHFKQILAKNDRAITILKGSKQGWKINKIDSKTEIAVKVSGTNVQLRYQGLLSTNIENICIMIYQVKLFNNWVPFCSKAEDLLQVSPLQKICYLQFKMPFLTERYAYFYALGIDRIDQNGTIVIYGQGITEKQDQMKKYNIVPDKKKIDKMVVMDLKYFICEISYKSKNQFYFRCYSQLDSHMPILPEWLVNTVIKQMGGFIFDKVIKQSMDLKNSVWQKQMKQDKDNPFYQWLYKRIQTWHDMHQKTGMNSKI